MRIIVKSFMSVLSDLYMKMAYKFLTDNRKPYDERKNDIIKYLSHSFSNISGVYIIFGNIENPPVRKSDSLTLLVDAVMIEFHLIEGTYGLNVKLTFNNTGEIVINELVCYRFVYTNCGNTLRQIKTFNSYECSLILTIINNTMFADDILELIGL